MNRFLLFLLSFFGLYYAYGQEIEHVPGTYEFIENKGQWPEKALFKADVGFGNIWLEKKGILYQFIDSDDFHHADFTHRPIKNPRVRQHYLYLQFVNCLPNANIQKTAQSSEYYNYFLGNKPSKWASGCFSYSDITYQELYKGIDARFFEQNGQLKYEFKVKPNVDPNQIQLKYNGQSKLKINTKGDLEITTDVGKIYEEKPYAYQIKNGKIIEIGCQFMLENGILSFNMSGYDRNLDLIIDPVMIFATYCGSKSSNFGMTATYAYDGKAYSGGTIYGNSYPTPALAWNTQSNLIVENLTGPTTTDVFISKYSEDGTQMIWTNFIGGGDTLQGTETVHSLICDLDNNVYLYGATSSTDFPVFPQTTAFQTNHNGGTTLAIDNNGTDFGTVGTDIYVSKISSDGLNLLGSTYVGGSLNDGVNYTVSSGDYDQSSDYDSLTTNYGDQFRGEIMLDQFNNILVTSSTRSIDFPTQNPFQLNNAGQQDGVVFKLASDFTTMLWSSYYGGSKNDASYSVKIDSSGNVLIAGGTSSTDLPNTAGGLNPTSTANEADGFVAKIEGDGSAIIQSTYVGTPSYDQVIFVEIDRDDNVYIVGQSTGNMPVINANYSNPNSGQFIMKLNPGLTAVDYATVFGNGNGQINISPAAFLVDVCGNVYVSGWGGGVLQGDPPVTNMPTTPDAEQLTSGIGYNFYLFVLERDAQSILYGSYLGSDSAQVHVDGGTSRFDKKGVVYQSVCAGCGGTSGFQTTPNAWSATNEATGGSGACNNLVFKFDFQIVPDAEFTVSSIQGCSPLTVNYGNQSNDPGNSVWDLSSGGTILQGGENPIVEYTEPGTYEAILYINDIICNLTDTAKKVITVFPTPTLDLPNDTIICDGESVNFDLLANGFGTGNSFLWADNIQFNNPLNSGALDSVITISPSMSTTYYCRISNGNAACDIIDSVRVQFSGGVIDVISDVSICKGSETTLFANGPTGTNYQIDWSPDSGIISEDPTNGTAIVAPQTSQYYYVSSNINGCPFYDSVWVNVDQLDQSDVKALADPTEVPEGGTALLTALPNAPNQTYSWIPANLVVNPTEQISQTRPLEDTTIFTVTTRKGVCVKSASVQVNVLEFVCGDIYVFVPNAFRPNGDGINDLVYVRGQNITEVNFKIFDRWGERVFETTDQSVGWDGTFRGKPLDPDVYVYYLEVICVDGQENLIKGNITLLK